jgi:hypothetical protein
MERKIDTIIERELDGCLKDFEKTNLAKLGKASLLRRSETKFIMTKDDLLRILPKLSRYYKILQVEGKLKNKYATVYFDTPNFELYNQHHNGVSNRYKIRSREYLDTNLSFIEIKFKNNKKKTTKKRMEISNEIGLTNKETREFIQEKSNIDFKNLIPTLYNHYTRITLVNKKSVERVTVDFDLQFFDKDNKSVELQNLVIAEIKQEKFSQNSEFIKLMHENLIRPTSFSKYCIGVSILYEDVKKNNFKENLLLLNKIEGNYGN